MQVRADPGLPAVRAGARPVDQRQPSEGQDGAEGQVGGGADGTDEGESARAAGAEALSIEIGPAAFERESFYF